MTQVKSRLSEIYREWKYANLLKMLFLINSYIKALEVGCTRDD